MVTQYGFSTKLGLISWADANSEKTLTDTDMEIKLMGI